MNATPSHIVARLEGVTHRYGALTALDKGEAGRMGPNPDTFAYIPD